jgi:NACalpha-BTF3-like transcription factor
MPNFFNLHSGGEKTEHNESNDPSKTAELDKAIRKASIIDAVGDSRSRKTDKLAVSTVTPEFLKGKDGNKTTMAIWTDKSFRQMMSFNLNNQKQQRITDYRELGKEQEIEGCVHEIAISCLASSHEEKPIVVELEGDYDDKVVDIINKELQKIVDFFELDMKGQQYFTEFVTTGELAFENVFSIQKPELGILDFKAIPQENVDPIFRNFYNQEIEAFWLRKPNNADLHAANDMVGNQRRKQQATTSFDSIPMARSQVTYCNSGEWDVDGQFVIPYILKGQKAQRKLSLIEDAIVINALVNAPERLLWNIPTGDMDGPSEERYMQNIMNAHKKNKGVDATGVITEKTNPMGITEDIYIPTKSDGNAASVTRLAGSTAFGSGFNGMLDHFHQKVYSSMHVPITRLNPDAAQSDGTTITMQELAFAERIESVQKKFAYAIKKSLITHLKLKGLKLHNESCQNSLIMEANQKGEVLSQPNLEDPAKLFEEHIKLVESNYHYQVYAPKLRESGESDDDIQKILGMSYWSQFELKENDIKVRFSLPTNFLALREQQLRSIKQENFNALISNPQFSFWFLAKRELGWTDNEIRANHEWKKIEAAQLWELTNIEEGGPNFRADAQAEAGIPADGGSVGGGGSALPSGVGGGGDVGEFGDAGGALDDLGEEPVEDVPPEGLEPEPAPPTPEGEEEEI